MPQGGVLASSPCFPSCVREAGREEEDGSEWACKEEEGDARRKEEEKERRLWIRQEGRKKLGARFERGRIRLDMRRG